MATGENESDFQHLAFGGQRNSCDSHLHGQYLLVPEHGQGPSEAVYSV